jgi:hypothetical protein
MVNNRKEIIKVAALEMLSGSMVMRKGELIGELERHMTATERGKHFFEVRESINELVFDGFIKSQFINVDTRKCEILIIGLIQDANNDN